MSTADELPQMIHRPAAHCAYVIERVFGLVLTLWERQLFPGDIHKVSLRYPQALVKTPYAGDPRPVMAI